MTATGLTRPEFTGTDLIVTANLAAATDTDVGPHAWQLAAPAEPQPAASPSALLSAV